MGIPTSLMSLATAFEIAVFVGAIFGAIICASFARANSKVTMALVGAFAGAAIVWLAWNPRFYTQMKPGPGWIIWSSLSNKQLGTILSLFLN